MLSTFKCDAPGCDTALISLGAAAGCLLTDPEYDGKDTKTSRFFDGATYISYLPLAHSFELNMQILMIATGSCIGFYQGDVRKLVTDDIPALKPTIMAGVPRVYARIYDKVLAPCSLSGLAPRMVMVVVMLMRTGMTMMTRIAKMRRGRMPGGRLGQERQSSTSGSSETGLTRSVMGDRQQVMGSLDAKGSTIKSLFGMAYRNTASSMKSGEGRVILMGCYGIWMVWFDSPAAVQPALAISAIFDPWHCIVCSMHAHCNVCRSVQGGGGKSGT